MNLSEVKRELSQLSRLEFQLPNGELVPAHFHVTEVGKIAKNFIDCGGKVRNEETISFQLWEANDYDHRLHPEKLIDIVELSEKQLGLPDVEVEVEYQGKETIGKFGLAFDGTRFLLTTKLTDCLAKDNCGIPEEQLKTTPVENQNTCTPGSGCC